MEENEKRRNVELAYLSLMLSGKKVSECELASEVLKISRAKGEKSLAMLVQSSIKIKPSSSSPSSGSRRFVVVFRKYRKPSSSSPRPCQGAIATRFVSTVNQVVAHWAFTRSCWVEGFGGTVIQAIVHRI